MNLTNFRFEVDADGIALVTWDMPGRSMNVLTAEVIEELAAIVNKVAGDASIKGAVVTSGKEGFSGGADLTMLQGMGAPIRAPRQGRGRGSGDAFLLRSIAPVVAVYRRLETLRQAVRRGGQRRLHGRRASNWRWRAIIGSSPTARRRASACRKSRSACFPAPAARSASPA